MNMRIWDVAVDKLCDRHLLGEHRELHAIWSILTLDKKGYRNHPETKRWVGKLKALYKRHGEQVAEMEHRGFRHDSLLERGLAGGKEIQDEMLDTIKEQRWLLKKKGCDCKVANEKSL